MPSRDHDLLRAPCGVQWVQRSQAGVRGQSADCSRPEGEKMGINRVCGRPVASWAASSTAQSLVTKQHWGAREESSDCHLPPTRGVHQPLQHPGSLQKVLVGNDVQHRERGWWPDP